MNPSGAVTPEAIALNEGRVTYQGGAPATEQRAERMDLIKLCRADEILDEEHMADLVEHVATWAPDVMRQKMLRKLGSGQARGHILRSDQVADLLVQIRRFRGDAPPPRA